MRNKAMKREALQAAREAKKERGDIILLLHMYIVFLKGK